MAPPYTKDTDPEEPKADWWDKKDSNYDAYEKNGEQKP